MLNPPPPSQMVPPPVTVYAIGNGLTTTVALPLILLPQLVLVLTAATVYVPAPVIRPKSRPELAPNNGLPTAVDPLYN